MILTLQETFNAVEADLSRHLVSPATFADIKSVASVFPDALSAYYLECRLGAQTTQVDLLACALASNGDRTVLAGQEETGDLPTTFLEHKLWRRVRRFCQSWANPDSSFYRNIPLIWLEFDIDGPPPNIPNPCVHICLEQRFGRPARRSSSTRLDQSSYRDITEQVFTYLLESAPNPQVKQLLFRCFDYLPPGGAIIHLSAMLSRNPITLKVYSLVQKEFLLEYLRQIGWMYSTLEIEDVVRSFFGEFDSVRVELNIGEDFLPKISLEFLASALHHGDPKRKDLLELCVKKGMCTPQKRESLFSWPGFSQNFLNTYSTPVRLRRWFDVKIVIEPDSFMEAKGYLGFMPHFSFF